MAAPVMIDALATEARVRLLERLARRVGDGRADASSEAPNTATIHTPEEYARLAADLAKLLADSDVNVRIGAARLIRHWAGPLREALCPRGLGRLESALRRACSDPSLNDYEYGGRQDDELGITTVADEAQDALQTLRAASHGHSTARRPGEPQRCLAGRPKSGTSSVTMPA